MITDSLVTFKEAGIVSRHKVARESLKKMHSIAVSHILDNYTDTYMYMYCRHITNSGKAQDYLVNPKNLHVHVSQ